MLGLIMSLRLPAADDASVTGAVADEPIPAAWSGKDPTEQLIWTAKEPKDHSAWALALLKAGASADLPAPQATPLEYALDYGNQGVALVLLEHGADAARADRNGQNRAWNAAFACYSPQPLEWMIQHHVPVTGTDATGHTILHHMMHCKALETGKPAFLPTVIYTDADTKAYLARQRRTTELLLAAGADINAQEPGSGSTPVMLALKTGHYEAARVLIDHGAALMLKDQNGQTAYDIVESYIPAGPGRSEFEALITKAGGAPK